MIYYLTTRQHAYTVTTFVKGWGEALAGHILVGPYDSLLAGAELPAGGVYVFSDLDRLTARERAALAPVHARLLGSAGPARVLNDPLRSLLRYDLLRALHESGSNLYNAHLPHETPARFPVFLRPESGFLLRAPPLLHAVGERQAGEIAVEFCDTADAAGVYRKYGAYVIGGRIVPRHLFLSRHWLVKSADLVEPAQLAEERAYVETNPHARQLLEVCRLARITWGRVDYSLAGGKLQVWEINTNPIFSVPNPSDAPGREEVHRRAAQGIVEALLALQ